MQRIVVVLPAPFGPRKPVTLPGSMPNVSPSTAVLSPYRFVRPRTSIIKVILSLVSHAYSGRPPRPPASAPMMIREYSCRGTPAGVLLPGDGHHRTANHPGENRRLAPPRDLPVSKRPYQY